MTTKHTNELIETTKRKIASLRRKRVAKMVYQCCPKCGGLGAIRAYAHVEAGVCFLCNGRKGQTVKVRVFEDEALMKQERELLDTLHAEVGRLTDIEANRKQYLWDHQAAIWEDEKRSQGVGTKHLNAQVGDRIEVQGSVIFTLQVEGFYGTSVMVLVQADGGEIIKTVGTGKGLWDLAKGDKVSLTGTVKALDNYKGTLQTVLTRVKVTAIEAAV